MNMIKRAKSKCENCFRPRRRRLGLFAAKDAYECYSENYVKCFWGMCPEQKSMENFISKQDQLVITAQPRKHAEVHKLRSTMTGGIKDRIIM